MCILLLVDLVEFELYALDVLCERLGQEVHVQALQCLPLRLLEDFELLSDLGLVLGLKPGKQMKQLVFLSGYDSRLTADSLRDGLKF